MNKFEMIQEATAIATKEGIKMAVVKIVSPEDGLPYGYCPLDSVSLIYPHSTVKYVINPKGEITTDF